MLPTGFLVSRRTQDLRSPSRTISPTGLSPSPAALPSAFGYDASIGFLRLLLPRPWTVWAPPLSLAATYGISVDFFSCRYLDVSVPCVSPLPAYVLSRGCMSLAHAGFPIRTSPDRCLLTAPRRISVFAPSFFASACLGFRHTPFDP